MGSGPWRRSSVRQAGRRLRPMLEIAPAKLEDLAAAILVAAGSAQGEAREVARHLVSANLKGHDSHGVSVLLEYVNNVHAGLLHPNRHARLVTEFGAIAVFDGDMGYGQITAREASEWGIAKAKSAGLAAVALRNTHHIARVGTYGELAAAAGLISLHFVNVLLPPGRVAPYGGIEGRFGTDPVCITYPSLAGKPPIVLDFATSKIAAGKIRVAFNAGKALDPGTLIDKHGQESCDPGLIRRRPRRCIDPAVRGIQRLGSGARNALAGGCLDRRRRFA